MTTLSIAASRLEVIKKLRGSFQVGEYLLLIFCVGLGLLADLEQLAGGGFQIVILTISTILGTVGLHLLLAKIFKVDDEAFLVTSTATIFGPPFIPQIAATIGNPQDYFARHCRGFDGHYAGQLFGDIIGLVFSLAVKLVEEFRVEELKCKGNARL